MDNKSKRYLIDGNDILSALFEQDVDRWETEVKSLKNIDNALTYFSNYLGLYFKSYEPSSRAVIFIDKPVRIESPNSQIEVRYSKNYAFKEEIKYELKSFQNSVDIFIVSTKSNLYKDFVFYPINYINPRSFVSRLIPKGLYLDTGEARSFLPVIVNNQDVVEDFIIDHLRENVLSLTALDINQELDNLKDTLFSIHFIGKYFPLSTAAEYVKVRPIIYVGYTPNGGAVRRLISDNSSRSNVRQILGVLLLDKQSRSFEIIKTSATDFKYDTKSEQIITDWIRENLMISVFRNISHAYNTDTFTPISKLKNKIVQELSPVLNLAPGSGNPYIFEITQLIKKSRGVNADEKLTYKTTRDKAILSERDLVDLLSEKGEQTAKQEWESIIDEMAHSINTDVYAALSYLSRNLENEQVKKASYNVQQIRDLTNLIMWYLKRDNLQLSGTLEKVSIENVIKTQIETIKAGIHTLRLTTAQHRDALLKMAMNIDCKGSCIIEIDKDLLSAVDLILKDVLSNALKNTDEIEPKVSIILIDGNKNVTVKITNNIVIPAEEIKWFEQGIESDELNMSKSAKVGLRLVKKWSKYLQIYNRITVDDIKKETTFHLTIPKEVKVEKST